MVLEKINLKSDADQCIFAVFRLYQGAALSLKKRIYFIYRCFAQSFVEIDPEALENIFRFRNCICPFFSPWNSGISHAFEQITKNALCQVWLNWPTGS